MVLIRYRVEDVEEGLNNNNWNTSLLIEESEIPEMEKKLKKVLEDEDWCYDDVCMVLEDYDQDINSTKIIEKTFNDILRGE